MGLFQAFDISASGMTAERFRMDTIAQNIANINTTRTEDGTPYRRKIVTFAEKTETPFSQYYETARARAVGNGVKVTSVKEDDETENTVTEMTNLIDATRAYEANTTAFDATKSMVQAALNISK